MSVETAIRESFARQSMMTTLGAEITHVGPGRVTIEAPILPLALQQTGHGHAALPFAIGDSAAGYAALTLLPEGSDVVTAEIKMNLLRPCAGERLFARGKVVKPGRRLVVVIARVTALRGGEEKEIALLQGTMVPV